MDHYTQQREIGKGAYGVAHIVQSKVDGSRHVMKKVRLARQNFKERTASLRELQLMASMHHRNVLAFREAWVESGCVVCIVVELCESGDLATQLKLRVNSQQLFLEEHLHEMAVQLASALEYIHKNEIAHRDIKSSNIFITGTGCLKLADFGLAVVLDAKTSTSHTMVGTPGYMAPQLMQEQVEYNPPSNDMWGLGCVLYELTALKPAFMAFNMKGLVKKVTSGAPLPLPSSYSEEWRSLIKALLSKDETKRPTAQDIMALPWLQAAKARVEKRFGPELPSGSEEYILLRELPSGIRALAAQFKEQEDSANRRAAEEKAKQKELKAKYAPKGLLQKQAQVELAKASAALKQVKQAEAVAGHHTDATSGTPSKPAGTCVVAGAGAGARPAPKPAPGQATKPALYNRRMASSQPARAHKPEVGLPRKPAVPRVAECRATSATRGVPHSSEYGARPESAPPSPTRLEARASVQALPDAEDSNSSVEAVDRQVSGLSAGANTAAVPIQTPQASQHVRIHPSADSSQAVSQPTLSKALSKASPSSAKATSGSLAHAVAAQLASPARTASPSPSPPPPLAGHRFSVRSSSSSHQVSTPIQAASPAGGITTLLVPRHIRTNPNMPHDHPGIASASPKGPPPLNSLSCRGTPDRGAAHQANCGAQSPCEHGHQESSSWQSGKVNGDTGLEATNAASIDTMSGFQHGKCIPQDAEGSTRLFAAHSSTVDAVARMLYPG